MKARLFLTIDGHAVDVEPGQSVLDAARRLGLDIPTLCYLEKCGPLNSCQVCLVKINGKLVPSCGTKAQPGMVVESETDEVHEARRTALELLFSDHVGDCLAPCNRLCPLRLNIPVMIRQIQGRDFRSAIGTVRESIPMPAVLGRLCHHPCEQGCRRGNWDEAAAIRDMERMVADLDYGLVTGEEDALGQSKRNASPSAELPATPSSSMQVENELPLLPQCKPSTGKSVVIVGAGPTGLAAAYYLLRNGHACTIADRHETPGGSLRLTVESGSLPAEVLEAETNQLRRLGAQFKSRAVLGQDVSIEGLLRGFDAVLIAMGEISKAEGEALGFEMIPSGIKTDAETMQTARPGVFAAGRCVRPMTHLVRAMSEGQAAAERVDQYLSGKRLERREKPVSSVMGRVEKDELQFFLNSASSVSRVSACDACKGFNKREVACEALRCLHCDCPSSGNCALQRYAQVYSADPNRFRQSRRKFEQYQQPGGVVFEPGKCIVCGICVKLTELASEPLGLAFIGRGFDVRVAAPFNRSIEEGLQKVAAECVEHCPTGALVFRDSPTLPG